MCQISHFFCLPEIHLFTLKAVKSLGKWLPVLNVLKMWMDAELICGTQHISEVVIQCLSKHHDTQQSDLEKALAYDSLKPMFPQK